MNEKEEKRLSIFISLILRHKPETVGIKLDKNGWADVEDLINGINSYGRYIDRDILRHIVETDEKQRYSFNNAKTQIRANQGHSINVDVELKECEPPEFLYHGTSTKALNLIVKDKLKPMSRLYVHLSSDEETARKVGKRHGNPVVIKIRSKDMWKSECKFYLSENGVWLTNYVEKEYFEDYIY